jgi:S-DNA-T family DNA segregation ATPase FtsK/SpoIIIE
VAKNSAAGSAADKWRKIAGILLILLAALVALSQLSYYVNDTSFNTKNTAGGPPQNVVGAFGAHTADLLEQFGGKASVLVPLAIGLIGYLLTRRSLPKPALAQVFGYLILVLTLGTVLAMFFQEEGGGIIGQSLAAGLTFFLGPVGGLMAAIALLLIALILCFDFSFSRLLGRTWQKVVYFGQALAAWWTVRREARRRRRRISQQEAVVVERPAPIIRRGTEEPVAPTAKEAKRRISTEEPVRSTRLDQEPPREPARPAPPPPAPVEPASTTKRPTGETITIHKKAETVSARQISFTQLRGAYQPPPVDLLQHPPPVDKDLDREALLAQSVALESKLETFDVVGKVIEIHPGPVITMFEYEPAPGIKVAKIANLEDDLAMALQAEKIRIIAPIPGKGAVGIEVPSLRREIVYLREILESKEFNEAKSPLSVAFGKDSTGSPMIQDLAHMPHLLVAGTTGSGKSVFLNCVIVSLMCKSSPDDVRLLMVDPKQLELSMYTGTPHMLHPVIVEPKKAALLLRWAVSEMEDRYRRLAEQHVRNIDNYNAKVAKLQAKPRKGRLTDGEDEEVPQKLPYLVIIIDELADLMMVAAKEVEESIARLAQMARAAGIHLILATQRPSVDVITGVIKANFPSRISFQVRSRVDSRTILDETGANNLLGLGDGLFLPPGAAKITRFHSAFISDEEVQSIAHYLKEKHPEPEYVEIRTPSGADLHEAHPDDLNLEEDGDVDEDLFQQALEIVQRERKASVSYIQRRLKIGYNRSARIIERMEQEGIISRSDGTSRPREVYLPEPDYED